MLHLVNTDTYDIQLSPSLLLSVESQGATSQDTGTDNLLFHNAAVQGGTGTDKTFQEAARWQLPFPPCMAQVQGLDQGTQENERDQGVRTSG
jgi:hypothetical protein